MEYYIIDKDIFKYFPILRYLVTKALDIADREKEIITFINNDRRALFGTKDADIIKSFDELATQENTKEYITKL